MPPKISAVLYCSLVLICVVCGIKMVAPASAETAHLFTPPANSARFLPPDQAFKLYLQPQSPTQIIARFHIATGYYLYRERIKFGSGDGFHLIAKFPPATQKYDPYLGWQGVYYGDIEIPLTSNAPTDTALNVNTSYQGCSEQGLCYAPISKTISLSLPKQDVANDITNVDSTFNKDSFWWTVLSFFGAGILLSLTPCILPMAPILSSIIINAKNPSSKQQQGLFLSLLYVFGISMTYTLAGIVAGMSGHWISQFLQTPWGLGGMAVVFVLLALSMFGGYELRFPVSDKFHGFTNKLKGGYWLSVLLMGSLSALIVSPCVSAPLTGALLYIGKSHDLLLGGSALFALSWGMSLPLLLVGASADAYLPKVGSWMLMIQKFFGFIMLGMAIWIINPIITLNISISLWGVLCFLLGGYLLRLQKVQGLSRLWLGKQVLAAVLLITGAGLLTDAVSNGYIRQHLIQHQQQGIAFTRIATEGELESALLAGKPTMLDFYADWCVACKELEHITFRDATVRKLLANTQTLQIDVTQNNVQQQALLNRFNLFGPPAILFFDSHGQELKNLRVSGFQDTQRFIGTLKKRCVASSLSC